MYNIIKTVLWVMGGDSTEYVYKLSVFCAALLVAAVSGVWVIRGFAENSKYYKVTAVITSITDFSTEHSNRYRVLPNGEEVKIAMAEVTYEAPYRRPGSFSITEDEKDKYSVGDELPYYGFEGTDYFNPASAARAEMTENLFAPILIFLTSAIVLAAIKMNVQKIKDAAYVCPKAFAFSVLLTVLCAGYTVYTVFIYDSHAIYFAGLAEFFAQLGSIVLSVAALIMVIIVWAIALQRIKKRSKYE